MDEFGSDGYVALHAGAWIETSTGDGLRMGRIVALHAGAWIETPVWSVLRVVPFVALHAGAWIETRRTDVPLASTSSPSMRGRGLKLPVVDGLLGDLGVALHAGAWIETF